MRGIYRLAHYPVAERPELVLWILWSCNRKRELQGICSHDIRRHETALDIHELRIQCPLKCIFLFLRFGYATILYKLHKAEENKLFFN